MVGVRQGNSIAPKPLRIPLQVWHVPAAVGSPMWWARRLGSAALLTSFPCPSAIPPGLAIGVLALSEFSLRLAPGNTLLWS